jgi:hypothetical protein
MKKHKLANGLRKRLKGRVPKYMLNRCSDNDIVSSYTTCSCCGEKLLEGRGLKDAIASAESAEDFIAICGHMAKAKHLYDTFVESMEGQE